VAPPDDHLQQRIEEKSIASAVISTTLHKMELARRDPPPWERSCLRRVFDAMFSGRYSNTALETRLALLPEQTSSASLSYDPDLARFDLALLMRAWNKTQGQPVKPFQQLGPIKLV
jgi:hypothetical protein